MSFSGHNWKNTTPETYVWDESITTQNQVSLASVSLESRAVPLSEFPKYYSPRSLNSADALYTGIQWHGAVYQESSSLNTLTDSISYEGASYTNYGFEYKPGGEGQVTWSINQSPTWRILASAMGPDETVDVGQRDISNEPMSIVMVSSSSVLRIPHQAIASSHFLKLT